MAKYFSKQINLIDNSTLKLISYNIHPPQFTEIDIKNGWSIIDENEYKTLKKEINNKKLSPSKIEYLDLEEESEIILGENNG